MSQEQPPQRHQPTGAQHLQPGDVYSASGNPLSCAERDRLVGRDDLGSPDHLVVVETGNLVTTVSGGQVMAQFEIPERTTTTKAADSSPVTIGEALEAAALTAGGKTVDIADAAAVQVAEMRATGLAGVVPGGVGSAAQKAVAANARAEREEEKTRLAEVVGNAAAVLPANKAATREDARRVRAAEERNSGKGEEREEHRVVAPAVEAAARINEERGP